MKRHKILTDEQRTYLKHWQHQLKYGHVSFREYHNALYVIYGVQ